MPPDLHSNQKCAASGEANRRVRPGSADATMSTLVKPRIRPVPPPDRRRAINFHATRKAATASAAVSAVNTSCRGHGDTSLHTVAGRKPIAKKTMPVKPTATSLRGPKAASVHMSVSYTTMKAPRSTPTKTEPVAPLPPMRPIQHRYSNSTDTTPRRTGTAASRKDETGSVKRRLGKLRALSQLNSV